MTSCLLSSARTSGFLRVLAIQRSSLVSRGLCLAPQSCPAKFGRSEDRQNKMASVAFMSTASSKLNNYFVEPNVSREISLETLRRTLSSL